MEIPPPANQETPPPANHRREQSWIDQLQVPDELDYINRLRSMSLDPQLLSYWIAMEVYRTQKGISAGAMGWGKLTAAVTAGGTIAAAMYAGLRAVGII